MPREKVKQNLPPEIYSTLDQIQLVYTGLHNLSYKALYNGVLVQIRIIKTTLVNHKNEINFISQRPEFLYFDKQGNFLKKWIDGRDLLKVQNVRQYKEKICKEVKKIHKTKIKGIESTFDWFQLGITEPKFLELVQKYKDDPKVISHNDLRLKNIILSQDKQIHLIDFEWICWNSPYFDYACLFLYCKIDKPFLISFFNLDLKKLDDYIYLIRTFNQEWVESKY